MLCCIVSCSVRSEKDKASFFRILAIISENNRKYRTIRDNLLKNEGGQLIELSKRRQKALVKVIRRGKLTNVQLKSFRACSKHFISGRHILCFSFIKIKDFLILNLMIS